MDRLEVEGLKGENAGDSLWRRVTARKEGDSLWRRVTAGRRVTYVRDGRCVR